MKSRRTSTMSRPSLRLVGRERGPSRSKRRQARVMLESLENRSLLTAGNWLTVLQGLPVGADIEKQTMYGEYLIQSRGVQFVTGIEALDLTGSFQVDTATNVTQQALQTELQKLPGFRFVEEFTPAEPGEESGERPGEDYIDFDAVEHQYPYLEPDYGDYSYEYYLKLEKAGYFPPTGGQVTQPPSPTDVLVNNNTGSTGTQNFTQSETSTIAFGNTVVVAYNDSGSFTGGANKFTGWSYSTDGGTTWTDGGALPTNSGGDAGDPVLARDTTSGTIYLATLNFVTGNTIQLFRSSDNGLTWSAPVNAAPGRAQLDKEWIAVDNFAGTGRGNVYHVVRDFSTGNGIFFFRSTDGGSTWGPSGGTLIASGNQGAFVSVAPDHSIQAYWFAGSSILMRRSTDLGLTFGPTITVASGLVGGTNGDLGLTGIRQGTATASAFRSNEFPHAFVNPVSGNIYVTYNNKGAGTDKADVFLTQSTDNGLTWGAPIKVNDDATTTDQWQPTLAVSNDGSRLGVFYYSRQEDPANNNLFKYYGRIAAISGSTLSFSPSFAVSSTASLPEFGRDAVVNSVYMGDYNTAAARDGAFVVSWSDNRSDLPGGSPRKDPNVYTQVIPLGLAVTTTNPAVGSIVATPPTVFTVNVTDPLNPATVQAGDFTVNSIPATSVAYTAGTTTLTFTFSTSPVTVQGVQAMAVAAGAFATTSGGPVIAFNGTFRYDAVPLAVTSTVPPVNGTFTLPAPFTLDMVFNETILAGSVTTSSISVSGLAGATVSNATALNATTARFTITGVTTEGTLAVSLGATGVLDQFGNPGTAFSANYIVDIGTVAYPTPLTSKLPVGSLIYDPSASGVIGFSGDIDSFTLSVDPNQVMTVLVTPTDASLRPSIQVFDSTNTSLGSATAAAAGQPALLQTVPTNSPTTATYRFAVGGAGGTLGAYTLQVFLNAAVEGEGTIPGVTNNTVATAQDINGSFTTLSNSTGTAYRGAVLGQTDPTSYSAAPVPLNFEDIAATGTVITGLSGQDDASVSINIGFNFTFYGQVYTSLFVSSNGLITFGSANSAFTNADLTASPTQAAIAPLWDDLIVSGDAASNVLSQVLGSGATQRLVIQWNKISYFSGGTAGDTITFEAVLGVDGSIKFNYADLVSGTAGGNNGGSATVGIKDVGTQGNNRILLCFNNGPNSFVNTGAATLISPPGPATSDFYSFTLNTGETANLAVTSFTPGNLNIQLMDSAGNVLVLGAGGPTNLTSVIPNWNGVLNSATYVVRVFGDGNRSYSLMVTRNAAIDARPNNTFGQAQAIGTNSGVLGSIGQSTAYNATAVPFAFEDIATTGTVISGLSGQDDASVTIPIGFTFQMYGTNYTDLFVSSNGLITFGGADSSFTNADLTASPALAAIAPFWDDLIVSGDAASNVLYQVLGSGTTTRLVIQWNKVSFFTGSTAGDTITFEAVLGLDGSIRFNYQDLVSGTAGGNNGASATAGIKDAGTQGANRLLLCFNNGPNAFVNTGLSTLITAPPTDDWYTVNLTPQANLLTLETTIPGGGTGQFVNGLVPSIQLFNSANVLVASGVVLPDGRNQSLQFGAVNPGTYRIKVSGLSSTFGEFFLASATRGASPAPVTSSLSAVTIDNGTAQRSVVRFVTVDFNGTITSAPSSAFSVTRSDGLVVPVTASSITPLPSGRSRVVLTFSGGSLQGTSLPDGRYTLAAQGGSILDSSGNRPDLANNGTAGSNLSMTFFRFFGDSNGDGLVDGVDLLVFRSAYLSGSAAGANAIFDVNGDGVLNMTDYMAFLNNYRVRTLP